MPGLGERILGAQLTGEIDQKVQSIKDALVPKLDALVQEQRKTNGLLDEILKELQYQARQKKK